MVVLPPPFFCTLLSYGLRLQGHLLTTSAPAELVEMAMKSQTFGYPAQSLIAPLKSFQAPIGKDRFPTSFFGGTYVKTSGVH